MTATRSSTVIIDDTTAINDLYFNSSSIIFSSGEAVSASNYSICRDTDATNQLHFNVPTSSTYEFSVNDTARLVISNNSLTFSAGVSTSGVPKVLSVTGAAHTGLTASTVYNAVIFDLNQTYTWATGALSNQSFVYIRKPTIAFAGASNMSTPCTLEIEGAPSTGANATLTNTSYAFRVTAGATALGGPVYFNNSDRQTNFEVTAAGTTCMQVVPYKDDGVHFAMKESDNTGNNNFIITSVTQGAKSHGHTTASTNPTLFIHSATDPTSDSTQWVSITHDQTNAVITSGKGYVQTVGTALYAETTKRVACGGGSTGATTTANGTVTLEINGVSYYLLKAASA